MNIKQKLLLTFGLASIVSAGGLMLAPVGVLAKEKVDKSCGTETSILHCPNTVKKDGKNIEDTGVWALLLLALNILTAGVGIVAVGGIVYGAILYTTAGDKADQIKKASGVIGNVVIGLIGYILLYAIVQYLIPGGVFN